MSAAVLLIDPHFPHNVGNALRACALHLGESSLAHIDDLEAGSVPVCVEITDGAEDLRDFVHPDKALYVFGPEDGDVPKGIRHVCHRFVRIPAADPHERTPYNLAFSVGAVLYDRLYKITRPAFELAQAREGAA